MKDLIRQVWDALFLNEPAFAEMRDGPSPALRGLGIVVVVALAVALTGLIGSTLEWATSPKLADIQRVVFQGIRQMEWYQELESNPEFRRNFQLSFDWGWRIFPTLFGAPNIGSAALRIVLLPLQLGFVWLLYGLVAHLFARLLGGEGKLGPTLGCTALAVAPQMLNLAMFLPYVALGGLVGTWTLLSRYVALKTCHRLTWARALAATLLPYVALWVLLVSFGCLGFAVAGALVGGGAAQ